MTAKDRAKGTKAKHDKLTAKQKAFAKEYAKTNNGTQSALAAGYGNGTNAKGASVEATRNLANPKIRAEIAKLMADNDIELANVLAIHKRNLEQDKHLPTSQKAVNDYYELVGLKREQEQTAVQIAFVVEK